MKKPKKRNNMSILGVIGIIFVVLKLLGLGAVAAWSWWLVLLPFYGGLLLFVIFALVTALVSVGLS